MIVWLNGTFGVGKTTLSLSYVEQFQDCRVFDPEHVGYMLGGNLRDIEFDNFQDLPPWRRLVPTVLNEISHFTRANIVAPQSVLNQNYWHELHSGMTELGLQVLHVVLDCDRATLTSRIENDHDDEGRQALQWRMDHVDTYFDARPWLRDTADLWLDTANRHPHELPAAIHQAVEARSPKS